MRFCLSALALSAAIAATPGIADTSLSSEIGARGIQPTIDRLAALPAPTDADRFALGGLVFLRATESALQARWQVGLSDNLAQLPFLRLPIEENPAPKPMDPALIASIFRDATIGMETARAALASIPTDSDFGLEIALSDLWFDVNANGARDPGEDLAEGAGPAVMGWRWADRDPAMTLPVIRFDVADAAWLSAYSHLLSGLSEVVLTYDPTESVARVAEARKALGLLHRAPSSDFDFNRSFGDFMDVFAVIDGALRQPPDAARASSAHAHFLAMIADNRRFWSAVATETDNDREWIPNDSQTSALGIEFPQGTGTTWLSVLADAEEILNGTQLIPYWRTGDGTGVNLSKLFLDPKPVDIAGWLQGWAAVPYIDRGRITSSDNLMRFEQMMMGESVLFMALLN